MLLLLLVPPPVSAACSTLVLLLSEENDSSDDAAADADAVAPFGPYSVKKGRIWPPNWLLLHKKEDEYWQNHLLLIRPPRAPSLPSSLLLSTSTPTSGSLLYVQ